MESYDFLQTSSNGSYGYKDKIFNDIQAVKPWNAHRNRYFFCPVKLCRVTPTYWWWFLRSMFSLLVPFWGPLTLTVLESYWSNFRILRIFRSTRNEWPETWGKSLGSCTKRWIIQRAIRFFMTWMFPKNSGFSPQIIHGLIGFSIINHTFGGVFPLFLETPSHENALQAAFGHPLPPTNDQISYFATVFVKEKKRTGERRHCKWCAKWASFFFVGGMVESKFSWL